MNPLRAAASGLAAVIVLTASSIPFTSSSLYDSETLGGSVSGGEWGEPVVADPVPPPEGTPAVDEDGPSAAPGPTAKPEPTQNPEPTESATPHPTPQPTESAAPTPSSDPTPPSPTEPPPGESTGPSVTQEQVASSGPTPEAPATEDLG